MVAHEKGLFSNRRLLASGASKPTKDAVRMWSALGAALMDRERVEVITGGLRSTPGSPRQDASDWVFACAAEKRLKLHGVDASSRIKTVLPGKEDPKDGLKRFEIGTVRKLPACNSQARRFAMVDGSDVVVSIEGEHGCRSVIDLALALGRPVLALPFGRRDTTSRKHWIEHRDETCRRFEISLETAAEWESIHLNELSPPRMRMLARTLVEHILRGFRCKCFLAAPFAAEYDPVRDTVSEVLESLDIDVIDAKKLKRHGNVLRQLTSALGTADFVLADISGPNANVTYEVGLAHAEQKPVMLIFNGTNLDKVPFDLLTERILFYPKDMNELKRELRTSVPTVLASAGLRASL